MRKAGKVWGETALIHANGVLEFHRIVANMGTFCSKHLHEFKWNGFYVESGQLLIRVWQKDYDLCDETFLMPGDFMQVKPGLYHSFEAVEDTVAFELYWAEFSHDDIQRETVGGNHGLLPTTAIDSGSPHPAGVPDDTGMSSFPGSAPPAMETLPDDENLIDPEGRHSG